MILTTTITVEFEPETTTLKVEQLRNALQTSVQSVVWQDYYRFSYSSMGIKHDVSLQHLPREREEVR